MRDGESGQALEREFIGYSSKGKWGQSTERADCGSGLVILRVHSGFLQMPAVRK
jgi:hypothetical protein